MCGIVGFISHWKTSGFTYTEQKMVYQMLFADQLRGSDATGVVSVYRDSEFGIMKEATDGYTFNGSFIDSQMDKELYKTGVAVIGHNRAKTIGVNKDENAHPFVVDKTFAMVHNGTLHNHKTMHDTDVDSEALAMTLKAAMDEENWKEALEDKLSKVSGAYACVWYDQKRDEICLIRNKDRPLFIVRLNQGTVFGSEVGLLTWIATRNNQKVEEIINCKEHTLYRFDMKKQGGVSDETFLSLKKPTNHSGFTNGTTGSGTVTTGAKATPGGTDSEVKKIVDKIIADIVHPKSDGGRKVVSKNLFKKFRATLFNRKINFWLDDYVEADVDARGKAKTVLIMGSSIDGAYDLCEYHHFIRAVVSLEKLGLKETELYGNVQFSGDVDDVEYDRANKAVVVRMRNLIVKEISNGKVVH